MVRRQGRVFGEHCWDPDGDAVWVLSEFEDSKGRMWCAIDYGQDGLKPILVMSRDVEINGKASRT